MRRGCPRISSGSTASSPPGISTPACSAPAAQAAADLLERLGVGLLDGDVVEHARSARRRRRSRRSRSSRCSRCPTVSKRPSCLGDDHLGAHAVAGQRQPAPVVEPQHVRVVARARARRATGARSRSPREHAHERPHGAAGAGLVHAGARVGALGLTRPFKRMQAAGARRISAPAAPQRQRHRVVGEPAGQSAISSCTARTSSSGRVLLRPGSPPARPAARRRTSRRRGGPRSARPCRRTPGRRRRAPARSPRSAAVASTPERQAVRLEAAHAGRRTRAAAAGARRCRSAASPVESTAEERRHEACRSAAARQHRVGLLEHRAGRVGVPAARLHEEAHHRAQRRGLHPLAGHVAHQHRHLAARAAARRRTGRRRSARRAPARTAGRSRTRAARGSDSGTNPSVSARAMRRSRSKSIALAIAAADERASRASSSRSSLVEAVGLLVRHAQHAVQPRPQLDRRVHQRADALGAHQLVVGRVGEHRLAGAGHVPEAAGIERQAASPSPARSPAPATVRSSPARESSRVSSALLAPRQLGGVVAPRARRPRRARASPTSPRRRA